MALRILVEVESAPGVVMGAGPLTEITGLRVSSRLSQAGTWQMNVPASAPNAELLVDQRTVMAYVMLDGEKTFLGGGAIDRKQIVVDSSGQMRVEVSGVDLLGEWSRESVGVLTLDGTGLENLFALFALKPNDEWTAVGVGTMPNFARQFVNESALTVWVAVAKQLGHRFVAAKRGSIDPRRMEYQISFPTHISLTCVMNLNALEAEDNPYLATIVNIVESRTSYELCNRLVVYGAGSGENRLTLAAATLWPDDTTPIASAYTSVGGDEYFYNAAENRITNASSYARLGDSLRSKTLAFPEVRLLANTNAGLTAAANTLVKAAVAHLEQRRMPQVTYKMKLADLRTRLYPGDKIHIDARRWIDGEHVVDIDTDVYVLSVTDVLDSNGHWTADVEASNIMAWPENTVTQMAQSAELSKVQAAHVQLSGNVDTTTHRETVAGTSTARLWFFLGIEAALINSVVLRYHSKPTAGMSATVTGENLAEENTGVPNTPFTGDHITSGITHYHGMSDHFHTHTHTHPISMNYFEQLLVYTYEVDDLQFNVGGAGWQTGTLLTGSSWDRWYELDITAQVRSSVTHRPTAAIFYIDVRAISGDVAKSCQVTAQVQARTAIQQQGSF